MENFIFIKFVNCNVGWLCSVVGTVVGSGICGDARFAFYRCSVIRSSYHRQINISKTSQYVLIFWTIGDRSAVASSC